MAFTDYLVSKFEEAPGVSGSCLCFGRVACCSFLSSPPSFSGSCFQPLCLPSPRPGLRSGLALFGSGPRRAPLSFVFVLAGLWMQELVCPSEFKGHMLEVAAITLNDFGGHKSESWFAACEFDQHGYKLESLVAGCEIDQPGKFLVAGLRETALVFSEFEGFEGKLTLFLPIFRHSCFLSFVRKPCSCWFASLGATWPSSLHCRYRLSRLERKLTKFPVSRKRIF